MKMVDRKQISVYGDANAQTLLLIHGSTVTRGMWQPQVDTLAHEYRVITLDLPGHGVVGSQPFTMDNAVAEVHHALELAGCEKAIIIGISLGGYVAIAHTAAYPEQTAGLVLASTTTHFAGMLGAYVWVVGWVLAHVLGEDLQRTQLTQSMRRKYTPEIAELLISNGLYPRAAGEAFLELAVFDTLALLSTLDCPILFLNGEEDLASRRGEAAFLAATRHGSLEIIPKAGHLANLMQPEQFSNAIRSFAGTIPSTAQCTDDGQPLLGLL